MRRAHVTRRAAVVAILVASALHASSARAQGGEKPPAATDVTPPRLLKDPGVAYPEQALREGFHDPTKANLILEIDATGAVTGARVDPPLGHGFDEAAVAAARQLVFEPAQREGRAIAAKIRFTYAFTAPAPRLSGKVLHRDDDKPIGGATVTVHGADGADRVVTTGADGTFVIESVPPGAAHIVTSAAGLPDLATDEPLTSGEETSLVLRLGADTAPPAAAPGARGAEEVVEITVRGDRPPREVTKRTLTKEEIDHIPGTNGDALKSLQSLPGVARPPVLSTGLVVRGSAPQDTAVFVDGTQIPLIYHFAGLSSVIPTELLEKIDFYPGNFSSVYGRAMGGIVDAGIRAPKKDGYHGFAQLDFIDGRLLAEGPIAKGWSFLVAGRRSWFDLWLTPILKGSSVGITSAPVYSDYQAEIQKDIGKHQTFRVLFFGGDDQLALLNPSTDATSLSTSGNLSAHTAFWRIQAKYTNEIDDKTSFRAQVAYGNDLITYGSGIRFQKLYEHPLSSRAEISRKIFPGLATNVGLDVLYEPYYLHGLTSAPRRPGQPDLQATDTPVNFTSSSSLFQPAAYAEAEVTPWRGIRFVPGVRVDYNSGTKSWDTAPRISARQDLTSDYPKTTQKEGIGVFYQPPTPAETNPMLGQAGLKSNRAVHYDVGIEQDITRHVNLTLDGFAKSLDRLVVNNAFNNGSGTVFGLETLLKWKADEHFFGWISYTLSRSTRRDLPDQAERLFQYDQTHILTLLGSYKLGRGWQLGGRFRLVSGPLDTTSTYGAYDSSAGAQISVDANPPYNTRLPLFHALDLRMDKVWTFPSWRLTFYIDIQNVYSNQNAEGLVYNYRFTQSTYQYGLPILPSVGLRAEF